MRGPFMPIQRDSLVEEKRGPAPREGGSDGASEDSGRKNSRTLSTRTDCCRTTYWHKYRPSWRCLFSAGRWCTRDAKNKMKCDSRSLAPKTARLACAREIEAAKCCQPLTAMFVLIFNTVTWGEDSYSEDTFSFDRKLCDWSAIRDLAREESGEEKARQKEICVKSLQSLLL